MKNRYLTLVKNIKIFLNKKHQTSLIFLFIGILISANLEMIGLGTIPIFINLILQPDQLLLYIPDGFFKNLIIDKDYTYIILFGASFITVFFILKNLFIFIISYFQAAIFRNIRVENSKRLFQYYLNSPYSFHLNRNPAIITRNITDEVSFGSSHISSLINIIREILIILVVFVLLLLVNPASTLVAFLLIGFFAVIFYLVIKKRIKHLSKKAQYSRGRQIQLVNQVFGAIKDTKILAREPYFINEYRNETKDSEQINFFSELVSKIPRLSMEIFAVASILAITLLLIISGRTVDDMLPMLGLLGVAIIRIVPSFNSITTTLTKMRRSVISFNLISDELKNLEKYSTLKNNFSKSKNGTEKFFDQSIDIKNISYEYPNTNKNILKNITFKIKTGSLVGIIGATGSGKSTLIDIILGLLEPTNGEIQVDENNIKYNYSAWQKQIGYIPQDIYLIDDTIRKNIAFGIPNHEIDEESVKRSIKLAQLTNFVNDLEDGLNTVVGDRGIRLSGGQRQRLGIARALYRRSRILILDEATSSLDIKTEEKLIKDIETLVGNYTIILVTHRLSTIKNCDNVILLSEGKLLDQGKFENIASKHQDLKNN